MAHLLKRGTVWYVKYKSQGKWRRQSCQTTRKVEAELLRFEAEKIERGEREDFVLSSSVEFKEYAEFYLSQIKANNSESWIKIKRYILASNLIPFFGEDTPVHEITIGMIEKYKLKRFGEVSAKTVNNDLCVLRSFLNFCYTNGLIPRVPRIKMVKNFSGRMRFLSLNEVKSLLAALETCPYSMNAYILLMLYLGLRSSEATNLRWIDIDFTHRLVHVTARSDWKTKNLKSRSIPMVDRLVCFLSENKNRGGVYVIGEDQTRFVKRNFMRVAKMAHLPVSGEEKVTAHTLRHTFASHLAMSGVPLFTIGQFLGHTNAKTTEIYAHLAPEHSSTMLKSLSY